VAGPGAGALRDESACTASISVAQAYAERIDARCAAARLYWLSPADVVAKAVEALLQVGRPDRAERLLERGIGGLAADRHVGDQQVFLTRLATAQLGNGRLEDAAASGGRALDLAGAAMLSAQHRADPRPLPADDAA